MDEKKSQIYKSNNRPVCEKKSKKKKRKPTKVRIEHKKKKDTKKERKSPGT